jgi:hypothetical protein
MGSVFSNNAGFEDKKSEDKRLPEKVRFITNHLVIEISDGLLTYKPRRLSKLMPWITLGSMPKLYPKWANEYVLSEGQINLADIVSFEADPGWPGLRASSVSITYSNQTASRTKHFLFSRYIIVPQKSYFEMVRYLQAYGLRDQSRRTQTHFRKLSYLFVLLVVICGYGMAKYFTGFLGIFGILLLIYSVLLIAKGIFEIIGISFVRQRH